MDRTHSILAALASSFVFGAPAMAHDDDNGAGRAGEPDRPVVAVDLVDAGDRQSGARRLRRHCMVGQRGPVWFLAGAFSGQPTVRICSVPDNVSLFFPVTPGVGFDTPGACDQNNTEYTLAYLRKLVAPPIDGATGLSVLLNNRPVERVRRVRSESFSVTLPPGNIFEFWGNKCIVAGQVYSPAADDGYYARLRPLPAGQHHLSIRGTDANGFAVDVFYTLTSSARQHARALRAVGFVCQAMPEATS